MIWQNIPPWMKTPPDSEILVDGDNFMNVEGITQFEFPSEYVFFMMKYNGTCPTENRIISKSGREIIISHFLSLRHTDKNSIFRYLPSDKSFNLHHFAIAVDDAENIICFRVEDGTVIFVNLDNLTEDVIADSFKEFIEKLY